MENLSSVTERMWKLNQDKGPVAREVLSSVKPSTQEIIDFFSIPRKKIVGIVL
jgi:hypothetical protein